MLERISHDKNIVQFYGACLETNPPMLVMEYMGVRATLTPSLPLCCMKLTARHRALLLLRVLLLYLSPATTLEPVCAVVSLLYFYA